MNILLTGGAGYIGSHVALDLLDNGHSVHIIDNLSTGDLRLIPENASFTKCNINDEVEVSKILRSKKFDVLMHFAGYIQVEESVKNPKKYFENNTNNSIVLFEICRKNNLRKIIFSSTAAAYGSDVKDTLINETKSLNPQNPYADSKVKVENYLIENSNYFQFVILRYFNVAGADSKLRSGQISKESTHLIKVLSEVAIGKKKLLSIYGKDYNTPDGTAIRDYIHVSDLANIHVKVASYILSVTESNLFNCGYGQGYSVLQVIEKANEITNNIVKYKFSNRRVGDVEKLVAETSKIKKYIKWIPNHNNLESIIRSSIEWEKKLNESF